MALFRGCPRAGVALALQRCGMLIGLALSPDELAGVERLDAYDYVLVSTRSHEASTLVQAAADLRRSNWSIDVNPTSRPSGHDVRFRTLERGGRRIERNPDRR